MLVNRNKFIEMVELVNTPKRKVKKMDYKQKQRYYEAKNKIHKVFFNSSIRGTYERGMKRG